MPHVSYTHDIDKLFLLLSPIPLFTNFIKIIKQNSGPFYGLSLGTFADGEGGVCVECSARVVAVVNTKDRLGRIDGRYPHWVDSYGHEGKGSKENTFIERYSLIYYETGGNYKKPGPAIFEIPYE